MENLEQNQPQQSTTQPQPAGEKLIPQPTPQEVSQTQTSEPKPKKSFLLPVFLSLGTLVLGGSLVFAYFTFLRPEKVVPQPVASPISSLSPSPDETAEWRTYQYDKKTEYTYSIKYPQNWTLKEWEDTLVDFGAVSFKSPGNSRVQVRVSLLRQGGFTLEDIIKNDKSYLGDVKEKNVTIQDLPAKKIFGYTKEATPADPEGSYREAFYIEQSNQAYLIIFTEAPKENYKQTFNLMLQTFKFTE